MIPEVRLRVGHQHLQFWPILAHFVDYYSPFSGLGAISTIDEPRGAFTYRSSTLIGLAGVSWSITDRFGVPKRFSWFMDPKVR